MNFQHTSVLLEETVTALAPRPGGLYLDGTLGGGGHAAAVLEQAGPTARLLGIDRDAVALAAAGERLRPFGAQVRTVHANFEDMAAVASEAAGDWLDAQVDAGEPPGFDGIMLDLGVSSPQLDTDERGFSYHADAPLDMRMDRTQPFTARELVNTASEDELARIIWEYGEERWSRRIAQFIVQRRAEEPLETTGDLVAVIEAAIPAGARYARRGEPKLGHPARRTFQALRIAVNGELDALQEGLKQAVGLLRPGGRLAVISFHSLEDRICKEFLHEQAQGCICPPDLPVCACHREPTVRLLWRRPVTPTEEETAANPRARSAKLRAAEKLGTHHTHTRRHTHVGSKS